MQVRRRSHRILLKRTKPCPPDGDSLATRRDQLFFKVKKRQEDCHSTLPSLKTAHCLLTRNWGSASWETRAQLIKAADWLIRLETIRANLSSHQSRQGRRSAW
jgi:hypothetical protein